MIDYNRAKDLFLKIYPDEDLQKKVEEYIKKYEKKISRYLKFCYKNRWEIHLKKDDFTKLCLVYAFLPEDKMLNKIVLQLWRSDMEARGTHPQRFKTM